MHTTTWSVVFLCSYKSLMCVLFEYYAGHHRKLTILFFPYFYLTHANIEKMSKANLYIDRDICPISRWATADGNK